MKKVFIVLALLVSVPLIRAEEREEKKEESRAEHAKRVRGEQAERAKKKREEKKRKKEERRKKSEWNQEKRPQEKDYRDEIAHRSPYCHTMPWQAQNYTENWYSKRESIRGDDWQQTKSLNDPYCEPERRNKNWF